MYMCQKTWTRIFIEVLFRIAPKQRIFIHTMTYVTTMNKIQHGWDVINAMLNEINQTHEA